MTAPSPPPGTNPPLRGILIVQTILFLAGICWMALRGRAAAIPELLVGRYGIVVAAAAGAIVGLVVSHAFAAATAFVRPLAEFERSLAGLLGPLRARDSVLLAAASGGGEEVFFRLAMQDALGPWVTAALFGLGHFAPGKSLRIWPLLAAAIGLVLSGLVLSGLGVAAAMVAHAAINLISLERMRRRTHKPR